MSDQEEAHVGPGGGCARGRRAAREHLSERALGDGALPHPLGAVSEP